MKINFFISFLFLTLICTGGLAQSSFPNSWEGNYKGELQIFGVDSIGMKLTMLLDITKKSDSIYQWKITYDVNGKADVRDYELVEINKDNGIYKIDEKNTILINSYYKMGIFTSFFEVMNTFIIATYTKNKDDIIFEIISGNSKDPLITGNTRFSEQDIPEVKSYLVNGRQKAILIKQELQSN